MSDGLHSNLSLDCKLFPEREAKTIMESYSDTVYNLDLNKKPYK